MSQTAPCGVENALCVNTTVPCLDKTDPMCQNTTKQQTETTVNLPCFTNLTMDVNLLNETGAHQDGSSYKYCVTTMAIAGPEYKACPEVKDERNDYRSVLAGNYNWSLTLETMKRPYTVYNHYHPTETPSGQIVIPLNMLIPCIENGTKLCAPNTLPICTTFNEIMCLETLTMTNYCEEFNTTCVKSTVPCLEDDQLCQNKTEGELTKENNQTTLIVDMPCFSNVTINSNLPNFDIHSFNGTLPLGPNTSYTYHYHYCVITLGIPGPETEVCLVASDKGTQ
ncbi:hypothetical protein JTB14_020114 [Gonioctena quinquepunctata]|nr:hypothetical protein JTB14_020114 [Gonioctena quinquepunctata]